MAQQFSEESLQAALDQGLIGQADFDSLMQQQGGGFPWGAAAGGTVAGLAGAGTGLLAGIPAGKGLSKAMAGMGDTNMFSRGMKSMGQHGEQMIPNAGGVTRSEFGGALSGTGIGSAAGATAGATLGGMADQEGGLDEETQQLIAALMSPDTSSEDKKKILAILQQMQGAGQEEPMDQEPDQEPDQDTDDEGFPWSQAAGGVAGAAIGAGLSGLGMQGAARRIGAGPGAGMMTGARKGLGGLSQAQFGGGAMGGVGLGIGGVGAANMMDPRKEQYADPLGQG